MSRREEGPRNGEFTPSTLSGKCSEGTRSRAQDTKHQQNAKGQSSCIMQDGKTDQMHREELTCETGAVKACIMPGMRGTAG